jgi:hypothetical protein
MARGGKPVFEDGKDRRGWWDLVESACVHGVSAVPQSGWRAISWESGKGRPPIFHVPLPPLNL